jgi:hypothetical protein
LAKFFKGFICKYLTCLKKLPLVNILAPTPIISEKKF